MRVEGRHMHMSEYMGEMGRFANDMELDHEVPFRVPGDREGTKKLFYYWSFFADNFTQLLTETF